jgi:diguanylate cyclase (GGDEF)-like protein
VMLLMVGRPIRKLACAAERLSRGQLDTELAEVGPTELRVGARALKEALASVRIAEAQTVALAEERLDAPVLSERAPGELGKSLQSAVDRLAQSLSERDNFQIRLEHEAAHDELTDLSNRAAILRHLNASIARTSRQKQSIALLFLDVDDFKIINDTHGHHTGDVMLQTISDRLRDNIREGDLAGRLGGDEFVVVAEPVPDIDAALILSERILEEVCKPVTIEGVTFRPFCLFGCLTSIVPLMAPFRLRIIPTSTFSPFRAASVSNKKLPAW